MAEGTELGAEYISILPSMVGFAQKVSKGVTSAASSGAKSFADRFNKDLKSTVAKGAADAGKQAGAAMARAALAAAKSDVAKLSKQMASAADKQSDALGRLRVAETKLDAVRKNTKATATQIATAEEAVASAQRKATSATASHTSASEKLTKAQEKEKAAADQVGKAQEGAATKSSKFGALAGGRFSQAFKGGFNPTKDVNDGLNRIDGSQAGRGLATRFGAGFNGVFGGVVSKSAALLAATVATVGIGNLVHDSIGLEATFSQTMNTMAAVAKVPADQIANLSDLAIQMGADTTFSAGEAANAMLELAKGGLDAATIQSGALAGTLTLAAAGGTSLETAATIASNALNTFGLKGKDMASVAAALAGGANASSASVESLGQALQQVGPGATNAGLSLQDTVGVLSSFDAAGIKGSDAGTSLKTMLTRLVPQTDKAASAMTDLGLKFTDATGNFLPITNIAQQLQDKLSGLSDEQQTLALSTIFGSDATRAATVLMKEGATGVGKFIAATKDQNAANEVAAARMSGTAGAIESFKGSVETATLQLGRFIAPAVQAGLGKLTGGINKIVPAIKGVVALFGKGDFTGDFAKAFGVAEDDKIVSTLFNIRDSVISVFGEIKTRVTPSIEAIGRGLQNLVPFVVSFATNLKNDLLPPAQFVAKVLVGLALVLVSAVGPAFEAVTGFIRDHATLFQAMAVGVGAAVLAFKAYKAALLIAQVAGRAFAVVQGIINAVMAANVFAIVILAIVALVAGLIYAYKHSEKFRAVVDAVFGAVKGVVVGAINVMIVAFHAVTGAIGAVIDFVKNHWKELLPLILGPIIGIPLFIALHWEKVKQVFMAGVSAVLGALKTAWGAVVGVISGPLNAVIGVLSAIWSRVYPILVLPFYIANAAIQGVIGLIIAGFNLAYGFVVGVFAKAWAAVSGVLAGPVNTALGAIRTAWAAIQVAFTAARNWVVGAFAKIWAAAKDTIVGPVLLAKSAVSTAWGAVQGAFTAAKDWVLGVFSKAWAAVKAKIAGPINDAKAAISVALGAAKGGLQWVFSQAVSGIGKVWDGLKVLAKAPIKFVIETVLNNGLISAFNWVAGKFNAPTIPAIPLPKGFAEGGRFDGRLPGPPSAVDNLVGHAKGRTFGLAGGEFVVNAKQTAQHLPMLQALNSGREGFKDGGLIGSLKAGALKTLSAGKALAGDIADFTKNPVNWFKGKFAGPLKKLDELGDSTFAQTVKAMPKKAAETILSSAKDLVGNLVGSGPDTPVGNVVNFRGKKLNQRTIAMLLSAEAALGKTFHITQGSYSTSVAASGSTHAGGGVMDTDDARAGWAKAQGALRAAGFAAWWRHPWQGPWNDHIHSVALGDPSASPSAKAQMASFRRGGDGLGGGMARGGLVPKALSFDNGGLLPTGLSVVHNGTGTPEPVGHDFLKREDLDGMTITIDAGSIGTLTGFISATADGRITKSNKDIKRRVGQGVRK